MGIGSSLKALLKARGTNVNKLSRETGISPSTLYSIIKRDNTRVSLDDMQKIADHLGVSLSFFSSFSDREGDIYENSVPEMPIEKTIKNLYREIGAINDDGSINKEIIDSFNEFCRILQKHLPGGNEES